MPNAMWPTPVADYTAQPASDAYSSTPSNGLAGFFSQPDIGAEIGDRLGVISEILGRLGSGQGMAGISSVIGQTNERSAARKDRRRKLQMVHRFADKIAQSNPEMAALMYANPDFGMELLGKQMLGQEERAGQLELLKAKGPIELQQAIAVAEAQGKASLAEKLAVLKAKQAENAAQMQAIFGDLSGGATPAPAPVTETATSEPAPVPAPIPPGMGAGQGTEPAPSPQPAPVTPPVTPPAPGPAPAPVPVDFSAIAPEPLSPRPMVAKIQQSLSQQWGIPVAASDATQIVAAMVSGDGTLPTIIGNIQQRYDQKKQIIQQQVFQTQQAESERLWKEGQEQRNIAKFESSLPPIQPATGPMGPMPQGVAQPGQDPRMVAILRSRNLSPGQFEPGQAGLAAERIEQGAREGNVSTPLGQIADEIAKRQGTQTAELDTRKIEAQRDAVLDPLIADPKTPASDIPTLKLMKIADPQKLAELKLDLSKETQDAYEFSVTQGYEGRRVAVAESAESRAVAEDQRKVVEATNKKAKEAVANDLKTKAFATDMADIFKQANEPGILAPVGPLTGATSYLPGGAKQLSARLENLQDRIGLDALKQGRQLSPTGASIVGNPTEKEGERLGGQYGLVVAAQGQDPGTFNREFKKLYNMILDVEHGVGQGPPRVMVNETSKFDLVPPQEAIPTYPGEAADLQAEQEGGGSGEPTMEDIEAEILKRGGK